LQEVRATAAKHWTERVWYSHNQRWMQSSKEGTEASRSGSFKNGQEWGRKCFEDLDQRRMGRPATRTCSTDFLLREGSSREEIGKWLKNKSVPWRRRRRLLQVVTDTYPSGQQMQKYGYRKAAACMLCQKAHEECGSSSDFLPTVTRGLPPPSHPGVGTPATQKAITYPEGLVDTQHPAVPDAQPVVSAQSQLCTCEDARR
jgi:hypothetical protein